MAWFWAVMEPMAVVGLVLGERQVRSVGREIQGSNFAAWAFIGLIAFQLFRTYTRLMGAIDSNKGLFTYRQIKPIDTIIIRSVYDFIFLSFIFFLFVLIAMLTGANSIVPRDALGVIYTWGSMWVLSLSVGIVGSALAALVEEVRVIIRLASLPLMLISGVFFPLTTIPAQITQYLMYNPIVHIIETMRQFYLTNYNPLHGTSMSYAWLCSLSMMVLGLMLHVRFRDKIKAQ